ncbi:hypothetical protein [Nonomuraea basaltis]|uniref:hypothetical protein n=1 Tax=Nonomuraea basaltis TaxID=2495887 RepID=UPI00197D6036|nr:hypothetical protein [Nonomuraea basaltis]
MAGAHVVACRSGEQGDGVLVTESRAAEPLVPMSFLSDRTRAVANGVTLLFSAAFYAMAFLLMIHLQTVLGYGPLQAGVAYLPFGAGILAGMWLSSRVMMRMGMRWALVLSFLISSAGLVLLLSGVAAGDPYAAGVRSWSPWAHIAAMPKPTRSAPQRKASRSRSPSSPPSSSSAPSSWPPCSEPATRPRRPTPPPTRLQHVTDESEPVSRGGSPATNPSGRAGPHHPARC